MGVISVYSMTKLFRNIMPDEMEPMVWVTEPSGACSFLSAGWYAFTGQTPATGVGYGWLDAVHPDDQPSVKQVVRAASQNHRPFSLGYRLRNKNGAFHWVVDAGAPRFDDRGKFLGYVGSVILSAESQKAIENSGATVDSR